MGNSERNNGKKLTGEGEPLTTPLLLLMARRIDLSLADLDHITIGLILDMWTEYSGDAERRATRADYDAL